MDRRTAWLVVPEPIRRLPADLAAVFGLVALVNLSIALPVIRDSPIRIVLGLIYVLFLPGYAFIAALFPEAGSPPTAEDEDVTEDGRGIDGIERVALSFGTSIAIVPLIGLVLNFTPWGIRLGPILVSVSFFTVGAAVVATWRRWDLPEAERFSVPYREWLAAGRSELFEPADRTDLILNVLLVASVILAVSSVAYAVAVPKQGETFTEFYLLTEGEDGELVADNYPTEFIVGEPRHVHVGIGNQEHRQQTYTVVTELQDVRIQNNSTRVRSAQQVDQWSATIAHNKSVIRNRSIRASMTGERLRLLFLLYRGEEVPANPTVNNAYRETHLWVNVSNGR